MAPATLPFTPEATHSDGSNPATCPLYRLLPRKLQEESQQRAYLWEYLHSLPVDQVGIPQYEESLSQAMGDMKSPNLIYPVGQGLFIHIYPDPNDSRDYYIAIEPGMTEDLSEVVDQVERRLVDYVHYLEQGGSSEDRTQLLLQSLDRVCEVSERGGQPGRRSWLSFGRRGSSKVELTPHQFGALRYLIVRDKEGVEQLEPLIEDPYIEDISCSGVGPVYIEHRVFKGLKASVGFTSMEELDSFVIRLSEKIGKPVTFRDPIVDATLPDGSRINIVFGNDVSKRGSNFTIRKFSWTPLSVLQLIDSGGLSYEIAAYLSLMIAHGMNVFISGETASGKTTLLNAVTGFIPPTAKIVSIEDTPELQVPHPNWIRETVRGVTKTANDASVTMFDLLKAALRQRPNEILIGEIRGEEGAIAFQAMQTGHAAMATFHAASVEKLIQRLTGDPINVPKTYIDNLNVAVILSMVRLPDGKEGRRILSINEIIGYDSSSGSFSFIEVFRWNPVNDTFEFTGSMNSYLLEEKIALSRGIPPHQKRKIYQEMDRRAKILKRLHQQGATDFYGLHKVLSKAYREGAFR